MCRCRVNLLNNAIKFTPEGGSVAIEAVEDQKEFRINITDTGIGLRSDELEVIFNEFRQVDSSVAKEHGGTGLGLSIAKRLVQMHKGRIWAESEYGKWSKFIFTLPKGK